MNVYVRGILKGNDQEIILIFNHTTSIENIFSLFISIKSAGTFNTEIYPDGGVIIEIDKILNIKNYEPIYEDSRAIFNILNISL